MQANPELRVVIDLLLTWYDANARTLPWRYRHHEQGNVYQTWLSEVMLQQTVVASVIPYFHEFISTWPSLAELSKASEDDVLTKWQGLGYYSRGRNLLKCARYIYDHYDGYFPETVDGLLRLPGVGPYTAAAIASIAFKQPVIPVDGNVIRVFSRLFALSSPLPDLKDEVTLLADSFPAASKPGDFAQALMDLGALICRPKNPQCALCPLNKHCKAFQQNNAADYPKRKPKPKKPTRYGMSIVVLDEENRILLEKRPDSGLLAGMMQVPTSLWHEDLDKVEASFLSLTDRVKIQPIDGEVKHTFTHFHLISRVFLAGAKDFKDNGDFDNDFNQQKCQQNRQKSIFVDRCDIKKYALPTVMKKIVAHSGF